MPRLPLRNPGELPGQYVAIFEGLARERGYVPSLYRVLANSPQLLADFLRMGGDIRAESELPGRYKELAILTVARLTEAGTMWVSHLPLARSAGIEEAKLVALPGWRRWAGFDAEERAVMAYAEEATHHVRVGAEAWEAVAAFLSAGQLAELVVVVAFYNMVARILEPLEIDIDPEYLAGG